jgi:hypothetical protein
VLKCHLKSARSRILDPHAVPAAPGDSIAVEQGFSTALQPNIGPRIVDYPILLKHSKALAVKNNASRLAVADCVASKDRVGIISDPHACKPVGLHDVFAIATLRALMDNDSAALAFPSYVACNQRIRCASNL